LTILDNDLAASAGFTKLKNHPRFFQMGIAQQDMISCAGGQALAGKRPVVHTYSNFLKRGFENIFINLTQKSHIIYMGTNSGLCYCTDGKSHQSINDISVMSAMPGLICVDPLTPTHAHQIAEWSVLQKDRSIYIRLRKTPCPELTVIDEICNESYLKYLNRPICIGTCASEISIITMGGVATTLALKCVQEEKIFQDATIYVCTSLNYGYDLNHWRHAFENVNTVVTIEDDVGALRSFVSEMICQLRISQPRIVSKVVDHFGPSFRKIEDCLEYFGFTPKSIANLIK